MRAVGRRTAGTVYNIVIVHEGDGVWADEVETRIRHACTRVLRSDSVICRFDSVSEAADGRGSAVVVCLCSDAAAASDSVQSEMEAARDEGLPVLPLVREHDSPSVVVPAVIGRLNAQVWLTDPDPALTVLRFLGIAETDRRLFLSYRRIESSGIALQLRAALSERAYDVFLDRFSVPPGDDFQRRIDIELADKALLVVLESESAIGSDWVQHEVVYALSHHIGVLALTLPCTSTEQQFEVIDEAFRLRLDNSECAGTGATAQLTAPAVERVLHEVELVYAHEVRRRRLQLLAAASDFLHQAGYERELLAEWSLLANRGPGDRLIVSVTPVAPTPQALRTVDLLRQDVERDGRPGAVRMTYLVHAAPELDPDGAALVQWVVGSRPLQLSPIAELPDRLR